MEGMGRESTQEGCTVHSGIFALERMSSTGNIVSGQAG